MTLLGHSLGGQIIVRVGLQEPEWIKRLVFVAPGGWEPFTALEKQGMINMVAATVSGGMAFTLHSLLHLIGFNYDREMAGDLLRRFAFYKRDAFAFGQMKLRTVQGILLEPVHDVLHQITQPCLVIVGKEDMVSPSNYLRGMNYYQVIEQEASKIPAVKLIALSPCGHYAEYQRPEIFNEEVVKFITEKNTLV